MGNNFMNKWGRELRGSPMAVPVAIAGVVLLLAGLTFLIEDIESSKLGWRFLENEFGVNAAHFEFTYLMLSVAPSAAQVILAHILISSDIKPWTRPWFTLILSLAVLIGVDFSADVYNRSNGIFFDSTLSTVYWPTSLVASLITLAVYTFGSEGFIVLGGSAMIQILPEAWRQLSDFWHRFETPSRNRSAQNKQKSQRGKQQGRSAKGQPKRDQGRNQGGQKGRGGRGSGGDADSFDDMISDLLGGGRRN